MGGQAQPRWYAVVLHWGSSEDTAACLASLDPLGFDKVVLVDNGTNAADLVALANRATRTQLVRRRDNGGYATGNNEGLRIAHEEGAQYVTVLNNDVVLEYPGMLGDAEAAFRGCDLLGALSPRVLVGPPRWAEQQVSSRFQRMLLEQACSLNAAPPVSLPPTLQPTPAFAGCAWMVPTKVLSKVGLLREDLFLYHEELEYAVRLKRTGFLCGRLGAGGGQVRHWGGMAEGLSPSQAYYSSRNLVRLLDGLPPAVRPRLLAAATGSVVWRALRCLAAGRPLSAANCARGLVDGFRGARGELGNRERRGRQ